MFVLHALHAVDGHRQVEDLSELSRLLDDPQVTLWLDLTEPISDESRVLHEVFRFHPLAIEDMLHDYGHPKVDTYDDHLFLILHAIDFATLDLQTGCTVNTVELDIFFGERLLVTHHPPGMRSIDAVHAELAGAGAGRRWTAARLLHRILDRLVDNFVPVIEALGAKLELLEDAVIQSPGPAHLDQILAIKKTILRLRRMTSHQRNILESLARAPRSLLQPAEQIFYRDVYDHFVYVVDQVESYREQAQSVMDAYHSVTANRMNAIMKALTQISTVMLPLTFIAGVYGMNFENMPELRWPLGYPFALGMMAATALAMILYFRTRRLL